MVVDSQDALRRGFEAADRVEALLGGALNPIPVADSGDGDAREPLTFPPHHTYVLGFYARARSCFRAVLLLAKSSLADEALSLARALFEDSLRLAILAGMEDESDRVDGLVGWLLDGVQRSIGLHHEAENLGVGHDHDAVMSALEAERTKMIGYRDRLGSGRRVPDIFSEQRLKDEALRDDRQGAWWLHEVADQMVHGNYFAHVLRRSSGGEGVALIGLQNSRPWLLLDIVAFAVESVVVAHQATCSVFGLPTMPDLDDLVSALEQLQAELAG